MLNGRGQVRRGFTLFEILLVLAIFAVVSALVLPSLGSRLRYIDLESAQQNLSQRLMQTRTRAMDQGRSWTFVIEERAYRAFPMGSPSQSIKWELERSIRFESDAVKLGALAPIYFHSDGTCSPSRIILKSDSGAASTIRVSRLRGVFVE